MSMGERLVQYTGVAIGGRGLLIGGAPGVGKTSLALCLIDRGATLIGDDGVALMSKGDRLHAAPPRATTGQLELRNVGIDQFPSTAAAVALSIDINPAAPRFADGTQHTTILNIAIPYLRIGFGNGGPNLADVIRVERAMELHGRIGGARNDLIDSCSHSAVKSAGSAHHD